MAVRDWLYAGYFRMERSLTSHVQYAQIHYERFLDITTKMKGYESAKLRVGLPCPN